MLHGYQKPLSGEKAGVVFGSFAPLHQGHLDCIKMWWVAGNWSMVAMYIAWTANCIYGWMNWTKLNKMEVANA